MNWVLDAVGGQVRGFYAQLGVHLPDRGGTEASVSCFSNTMAHKNGDRNASCTVNLMSGLWKCHGCGAQGNPYQAALALGCNERRGSELAKQYGLFLEKAPDPDAPKEPRLPDERKLRQWRGALVCSVLSEWSTGQPFGNWTDKDKHISHAVLTSLKERKGWTAPAVVRCGLGFDGERITFTIRDKKLKRVGVVRYTPNPKEGQRKTLALGGTKRGLFPPPEVMSRQKPLYVVEGEPDAVSVRSCGLQAVAVPGTGSWRTEYSQRLMPFNVVCLTDADPQGRGLARKVSNSLPRCKVVDIEPNKSDGSDIGDWVAEASREGGLGQIRRTLERLAV